MEDIEKFAKKIWNYLRIDNELQKADVIAMFGSHDPLVAEYASQLYLDDWAPIIVFSGSRGKSTADWEKNRGRYICRYSQEDGCPRERFTRRE